MKDAQAAVEDRGVAVEMSVKEANKRERLHMYHVLVVAAQQNPTRHVARGWAERQGGRLRNDESNGMQCNEDE